MMREATGEITLEEISDVLSGTIVNDETNKQVLFISATLTFTEDDQQNIAFNAPSSTGKSHLALRVAELFPPEDVMILGLSLKDALDAVLYNKKDAIGDLE